jgi:putrescine transport system ATP-binding protein
VSAAPLITFEHVTKRYGAVTAVDDVSLEIGAGEFFALLGPSGCGKTTLMRLIAGFETPDAGRILIDGRDMADMPPHARPVNMMFQSYALFPHMNVARNIGFGLVQAGRPGHEIDARVSELLRLVQLEGLGARKPDQLSGGQRQRVALARALARKPRLVLLDEPLAALDRKLREETQFELMRLQRELGTGFMLVTHDQDEAMAMAHRIAVMRAGRIEQVGVPRAIYEEPASRFVAGFIGEVNLFEGVVERVEGGRCFVRLNGLEVLTPVASAASVGERVTLAVRPERMLLKLVHDEGLAGVVLDSAYRGDSQVARVQLENGSLVRVARFGAQAAFMPERGAAVRLGFPSDAARILPP